jgi:hypothetical protein
MRAELQEVADEGGFPQDIGTVLSTQEILRRVFKIMHTMS